jgi:hypothetical protein
MICAACRGAAAHNLECGNVVLPLLLCSPAGRVESTESVEDGVRFTRGAVPLLRVGASNSVHRHVGDYDDTQGDDGDHEVLGHGMLDSF